MRRESVLWLPRVINVDHPEGFDLQLGFSSCVAMATCSPRRPATADHFDRIQNKLSAVCEIDLHEDVLVPPLWVEPLDVAGEAPVSRDQCRVRDVVPAQVVQQRYSIAETRL